MFAAVFHIDTKAFIIPLIYFNCIYIVLVLLLQTLSKNVKSSSTIHYLWRKWVEPAIRVASTAGSDEAYKISRL